MGWPCTWDKQSRLKQLRFMVRSESVIYRQHAAGHGGKSENAKTSRAVYHGQIGVGCFVTPLLSCFSQQTSGSAALNLPLESWKPTTSRLSKSFITAKAGLTVCQLFLLRRTQFEPVLNGRWCRLINSSASSR